MSRLFKLSLRCLVLVGTAVSVQVRAAGCAVTTSGLAFGLYNPILQAPLDSSTSISLNCSGAGAGSVSYSIRLSPGGSGAAPARVMAAGGSALSYNIYTDPSHVMVWGDGSSGTTTVNGSLLLAAGSGTAVVGAYGRIPPRQTAVAGSYADVLTVTVSY